ncbi:MAG TPA: bifunctional diaminohydroxyphosphoribosylaminopyrimidine deaminase/5-amino-6-(5-phosphoribosylamino)uracil reductase RibD [Spirochaetota bacterium]|nr:bifunctional diaminohydroxyphosphoribosylaminopyrimidine deaminase/5-amino-6-(5-phosphoribosylamino)uracil reductase RibD [Spirochaetota bacterium]
MENKKKFMRRACEIAFSRMGHTSPNPAVGAVIVKNGNIAGEGGTGPYGSDHAEVRAIKDAKCRNADLEGAEIFVSLEPCSHYGKTPPCTEAIISSGIKKVYVPLLDPNPLVSGKGIRRLAEAGIEVEVMHQSAAMASDLLRGFKKYILRGEPYIINKCAMTLDGRIATSTGDSKWISNDYSRLLAHRLRSVCDAVIIGKNTFATDNPSLGVRFGDFGDDVKNYMKSGHAEFSGRRNFFIEQLITSEDQSPVDPLRVLAGMPSSIPENCNFTKDDNYVIITGRDDLQKKVSGNSGLKDRVAGLNIVTGDFNTRDEEIIFIMNYLKGRGVMSALLEGGAGVNGSFLDAGATDQFIYNIAPMILGSGLPSVNAAEKSSISQSLQLHDITSVMLKGDVLFCGYREQYNFEMM